MEPLGKLTAINSSGLIVARVHQLSNYITSVTQPLLNAAMAEWLKALDLKSNGIFPRKIEPYWQRTLFVFLIICSLSRFSKTYLLYPIGHHITYII